MAMVISPLARGLFHGVISMSGSPRIDTPRIVAEKTNLQEYIPVTACAKFSANEDALYECLIHANATDLMNATPVNWGPPWFFGLPQFGEVQGAAGIVDGDVIRQPMPKSFQMKLGSDVPIIFGAVAEEPDMFPFNRVLNYSNAQYVDFMRQQYESYVFYLIGLLFDVSLLLIWINRRRFAHWGNDFTDNLLAIYNKYNDFVSPQQSYDRIVAEVRMTCGNIAVAKVASESLQSNVFFYIAKHFPSKPLCQFDPVYDYCPRYTFHAFDLLVAFNDAEKGLLSAEDQKYGDILFNRFKNFLHFGGKFGNVTSTQPEWPRFTAAHPVIMKLETQSTAVDGYKQPECEYWHKNGFEPYWIQN
jgi:carboxylesterase type B